MKTKELSHKTTSEKTTYILVMEIGEDVLDNLCRFAGEKGIQACYFSALGAFSQAELAYFNWENKSYEPIQVLEQVEVLSLTGNISLFENKPKVHAHAVLGRKDGSTLGGHLVKAYVQPTLEIRAEVWPTALRRETDTESGLPLLTLE